MTTPKYTEEQVVALLEQQAKAQAEAAGKTPPEDPPKDPPSGPVTNLDASTIAAARKIVEAADAIKSDPPADKTPPADQTPPAFNAEAEFAKLSEQVKALTARPPASNGGAPTTPPAYDPSRAEPFLPGMTEAQKAEAVGKWIEVNGQKSMVDLGLAVMAGGG